MAKSAQEIRAELRARRESDAKKDLRAMPVLAEPQIVGVDARPVRQPRLVTPKLRTIGAAKNSSRASAPTDLPPHSADAEQGVLGSMLKDARSTIPEVVAHLNEDYFYLPANALVYKAIVGMWDKGKAVDLITLTQHLIDVGRIESVGGPFYVTSLFNFVPTSARFTVPSG